MHLCSLAIDRRIDSTEMWLCDSAMDLALHNFNREQDSDGGTLYMASLLLQERVDVAPTTAVDGRRPADCNSIVKCTNIDGEHWIAAD